MVRTIKRKDMREGVKKLVIFAPFAGLKEQAEFDHLFAEQFVRAGFPVVLVRCSGLLAARCAVMGGGVLDPNMRKAFCDTCRFQRQAHDVSAHYDSVDITDLLTEDEIEDAQREVGQVDDSSLAGFQFRGVPLGQFSSYDTAVEFKTIKFQSDPEALNFFREVLLSSLLAYLAGVRAGEIYDPSAAAVYSFEYTWNRSFLAGVGLMGAQTFSYFQSPDKYRYRIFRVIKADRFKDDFRDRRMSQVSSLPISRAGFKFLRQHFQGSVSGSNIHSYSTSHRRGKDRLETFDRLGLSPGAKVIAVLTSSPDELDAGNISGLRPESRVFEDDLSIAGLVGPLARQMRDYFFVVRIHPRLLPNRRDSRTSSRLQDLVGKIGDEPNVIINFPKDDIGIYELAAITNCALSARSSTGFDYSVLGVPVVFVDPSRDPHLMTSAKDSATAFPSTLTLWEIERQVRQVRDQELEVRSLATARFIAGQAFLSYVPLTGLNLFYSGLVRLGELKVGVFSRLVRALSSAQVISPGSAIRLIGRARALPRKYPPTVSLPFPRKLEPRDPADVLERFANWIPPSVASDAQAEIKEFKKFQLNLRRTIGLAPPTIS